MNDSALVRTPVEIWEAIIDWTMYDRDALELYVERPATLKCNSRLRALQEQYHILLLVCRSWTKHVSSQYEVHTRFQGGNECIRYRSPRHYMDFGEADWGDVQSWLRRYQYVYYETAVSGRQSGDPLGQLLEAFSTHQSQLRFLKLDIVTYGNLVFLRPKALCRILRIW